MRSHYSQFYVDIAYGLSFAAGLGYLLFVGMDPRVVAFQGGLVFGYILRVWEKMSVYDQILQKEVAAEAEEAVAEEAEEAVAEKVEKAVGKQFDERMAQEIDEWFDEELNKRVTEKPE